MLKFSMPFLRMSLQEFEGDDIYIFLLLSPSLGETTISVVG